MKPSTTHLKGPVRQEHEEGLVDEGQQLLPKLLHLTCTGRRRRGWSLRGLHGRRLHGSAPRPLPRARLADPPPSPHTHRRHHTHLAGGQLAVPIHIVAREDVGRQVRGGGGRQTRELCDHISQPGAGKEGLTWSGGGDPKTQGWAWSRPCEEKAAAVAVTTTRQPAGRGSATVQHRTRGRPQDDEQRTGTARP
jgi:hypothetical protein